MDIYQGMPINAYLDKDTEDGGKEPSLAGFLIEAMLVSQNGKVLKSWSSNNGGITISTYQKDGKVIGYASFGATGGETKLYPAGNHTLEMSISTASGRSISVLHQILQILPAKIKDGVV